MTETIYNVLKGTARLKKSANGSINTEGLGFMCRQLERHGIDPPSLSQSERQMTADIAASEYAVNDMNHF